MGARDEAAHKAWLESRRLILGASDVPAVCGLDPHRTGLDVYASKRGLDSPVESIAQRNGNRYEPLVLEEYEDRRQLAAGVLFRPGLMLSRTMTWAGATPDALYQVKGTADRDVQVKCVGRFAEGRWGDEDAGAEGVPEHVIVQVQWEMLIAEVEVADVVAKFSVTEPVRIYEVRRDEAMIAMLVDICAAWWQRHVVEGELPEIVRGADAMPILRRMFRRTDSRIIPAPDDVANLALAYVAMRDTESEAHDDRETIGAELAARIGAAEVDGFEGPFGRVTWRPVKGRPAWKAIAADAGATPELIERHTGPVERRLDVRLKGE